MYDASAVEQGLLRSDCGAVKFAAFQPGADRYRCASTDAAGSAGARPVLQGLLAASRAVWESSALLHRAVVLAVTLRVGNNSQPPTFSLYIRLVTFRASTSGTVGLLPRHAQSTPCAAREKNRVLLSHAAQGVYQTYI